MVFVLTDAGIAGTTPIRAMVQLSADADNTEAEFAILVTRESTALGLGPYLLQRIVEYARDRGIARVYGDVLADNLSMLMLARAIGFTVVPVEGDPSLVRIEIEPHATGTATSS
jgi:acetyltransferase